MASLAPRFSSVRMLQEYLERAYVPGAASYGRRAAEEAAVARSLAQWSRHLEQHWSAIRFGARTETSDGRCLTVSVPVFLDAIAPDAVRVELYADADAGDGPVHEPMIPVEAVGGVHNAFLYRATVQTARPAWHFTPRVVPFHTDARIPIEMPLITWER
jgi:starch phosphorylase